VKEVLQKRMGLGDFQIIVDRDQLMDRLIIKVESHNQVPEEGMREAIIDDLRAVTRLRAEIHFVSVGSLADGPAVIDLRSEVQSRH